MARPQNFEVLSVSALNQSIKNALHQLSLDGIWVKGEILSYKADPGRRYASFILCEKDENSHAILAQVQAMCWGADLSDINYKLKSIEKDLSLKEGLVVQLKVMLDLWPQAGRFQVLVKDIEPSFTLGELHLSRLKIYNELVKMGIQDNNKQLHIPVCPLKIALITSRDCAGYKDFLAEIKESKYPFEVDFYHAAVQGERVEEEVVRAIKGIRGTREKYDVVVIVRGGGALTDLKWFDNKKIGMAIANCPVPVLTGIGHEINLSVADMVANQNFKTPTAAAAYLVNRVREYARELEDLIRALSDLSRQIIKEGEQSIFGLIKDLNLQVKLNLQTRQASLSNLSMGLIKEIKQVMGQKAADLSEQEEKINIFSPANTLKLGFTITRDKDGKVLKDIDQIQEGEGLITQLAAGRILSNVIGKERNNG